MSSVNLDRSPWASPLPTTIADTLNNDRLVATLKPFAAPVAISFLAENQPVPVPRRDDPYPQPNEHGRTGQVPAGCVFWIHGSRESFSTTASDHANCSVGSLTHGFLTIEEATTKDDVGAVFESGWVDEASMAGLTRVMTKPGSVVYGPLADSQTAPDVVLLRINALGLMTLTDALPELRIEGKPQCHIVAIAKEQGAVAASVGCALSRARTGMKAEEMTCAIPGPRLNEVVEALRRRSRWTATWPPTRLGTPSVSPRKRAREVAALFNQHEVVRLEPPKPPDRLE